MAERIHRATLALGWILCCLLVLSSLPQTAHADSVVEKFPTTTSVIVAGWEDPTNVYALDGNVAFDPSVDDAEQEYADFGFALNATDTVEKVYVKISGDMACAADSGEQETDDIYIKVWDGAAWTSYKASGISAVSGGGYCEAVSAFPEVGSMLLLDVTDKIDTVDKVNNIKLRLYADEFLLSVGFIINVDALAVEVAYTTPAPPAGLDLEYPFLLIGIPIGFMFAVPLFYYAKTSKERSR